MKYYYVKNAWAWVILRLIALLAALVAAIIYVPRFFVILLSIYLVVDLIMYVRKHGFTLDNYFRNALQSWRTVFGGKTFGKYVVGISNDTIQTEHSTHSVSEIKSFHPARGGSEPYLIFNNGERVDLEVSWLNSSDRREIEARLKELISQ